MGSILFLKNVTRDSVASSMPNQFISRSCLGEVLALKEYFIWLVKDLRSIKIQCNLMHMISNVRRPKNETRRAEVT